MNPTTPSPKPVIDPNPDTWPVEMQEFCRIMGDAFRRYYAKIGRKSGEPTTEPRSIEVLW